MKSLLNIRVAIAALAASALLSFANNANAVSFDYSSSVGSKISFDGAGNFSFLPGTDNIQIDSGTAAGLFGEISGTYAIGAITTIGGLSSAPITGTGTFTIHDGANDLIGTLTWVNMYQLGVGSTINYLGAVNLTGVTYSGSNADLLALAAAGSAINTLTFQFSSTVSLLSLKTSAHENTFSGTIATVVPDGGLTLALLGFALAGVEGLRRRFNA